MGPHVLVTNDDGIDSPGLVALARCALDLGWPTVVAAPGAESSGTSAGLTAVRDDRRIAVSRRTLPDLPGVPAYAVAAHPGLIALAACHDGFGGFGERPDLVLSGVNRGSNVGRVVLHSGTVGAALTAGINGARALAVSLDVPLATEPAPHWDTAKDVVAKLLPGIAALPAGAVLNMNVPDVPTDQVREMRWAHLATCGRVQSKVTRLGEDLIEVGSVVVDGDMEPDTDTALLADGHVTITPLRSVHEDESLFGVDLRVSSTVRTGR